MIKNITRPKIINKPRSLTTSTIFREQPNLKTLYSISHQVYLLSILRLKHKRFIFLCNLFIIMKNQDCTEVRMGNPILGFCQLNIKSQR